jgi:hypothetical protein
MSFGGHVAAMIKSLSDNKKLKDRNSYFKNHSDYKHSFSENEIFQRTPTNEEMELLRSKIAKAKKEQMKVLIISFVFAVIFIVLIALLIRWFILNDMELF